MQQLMGAPEVREKGAGKKFKGKVAENFPNLMKDMNINIQ